MAFGELGVVRGPGKLVEPGGFEELEVYERLRALELAGELVAVVLHFGCADRIEYMFEFDRQHPADHDVVEAGWDFEGTGFVGFDSVILMVGQDYALLLAEEQMFVGYLEVLSFAALHFG